MKASPSRRHSFRTKIALKDLFVSSDAFLQEKEMSPNTRSSPGTWDPTEKCPEKPEKLGFPLHSTMDQQNGQQKSLSESQCKNA